MSAVLEKVAAGQDDRIQRARDLRELGLSYRVIARRFAVSPTTVRRWVIPGYAEHLRVLSRDAKRRRTGTCKQCGGTTHLTKTGGLAEICGTCAPDYYAPIYRDALIGRGPITERARELLADGPKPRSYLRSALGLTQAHVSVLLVCLQKQGYVERAGPGLYQLCSTKSPAVTGADPSPNRRAEPSDA